MISKIEDKSKQGAIGLIEVVLLLVVLPLSLFGVLLFLDTHFLEPGDPIPDRFILLFLTAEGEPKVVRWTELGHFKGTYPGFTFKLPGPSGSYSPKGPHGPLIQWSVQPQASGEDLVEVVWTGYDQTDFDYQYTSRYTVKGQDVVPSYFQEKHIGQALGTGYLTVLAWLVLVIGSVFFTVLKGKSFVFKFAFGLIQIIWFVTAFWLIQEGWSYITARKYPPPS